MVAERFTVVALPHTKSADANFHVSLFVAPDLTPDGEAGQLDDFDHFTNWAQTLLSNAEFELFDQSRSIPAVAVLDPIDPAAWEGAFPPDTPVRAPRRPEWSDRRWRTFNASLVHDSGKLFHLLAMYVSPVSPPLPSAHPIQRLMTQWFGRRERDWDESEITRSLDQLIGETEGQEFSSLHTALVDFEESVSSLDPITRAVVEIHRARRFYERPESKLVHQERPDEHPVVAPIPRPEPDFHDRCGFVADHPALQRQLGLVVDLRLEDPTMLATSTMLSATITLAGDPSLCRTTQTACRPVGDDLVTVASSSDWHDGALRLGDVDTFAVLDMDPDGTGLKLDRFLWSLPRLARVEDSGGPVHAAPSALRSIGFTVARRQRAQTTKDRMDRQHQIAAGIDGSEPILLSTEDVTRGMRVEVWDDSTRAWYSLHARRIDAEVVDGPTIADDLYEEGFIQGTTATETRDVADSPVHVHESMFGWDGWSLAAPRPGKRVRHADEGTEDADRFGEVVEDAVVDPDPVTPLVVTNRVEPGTLPSLRYGRSYAFRVWAVDLAGNSRPHATGPAGPPDDPSVSAMSANLPQPPSIAEPELTATVRGAAAASVVEMRDLVEVTPLEAHDEIIERIPDAVLGHLRERRVSTPLGSPGLSLATVVGRAFADTVLADDQPFAVETAVFDPTLEIRPGEIPTVDEIATVSPLRPFLRWDPVQPPAIVARHQLTAGESLRQVVVRSGVSQDRETLEIVSTTPSDYAAELGGLGYRPTSERHLVPPKTSQSEAELHGGFDRAIGSTNAGRHQAMLAIALREAGSLFDVEVPRLDDPAQSDPQPGISLASDPTVPVSVRKTLPLPPGEPPAPGQYVVHDVDELLVPYLPDLAANGISLVFPEAGRDRSIAFPFGTEGFTASYRGSWPEIRSFRLELQGSDKLEGRLVGTELRIGLPPGDVQRFRLASSISKPDLDIFGLWRILPPILRDNPDISEAAADGWLWALTPFEDVTLVHAVPRPLEAPRPTALAATRRGIGSTEVVFSGAVDVHGPSTEQLTAEATWVDPIDDLSLDGPNERAQGGIAFTTRIREEEDLAVLSGLPTDVKVPIPGFEPVWVHGVSHPIGDTRHHRVRYRMRASTRFREYFDPEALVPEPDDPSLPRDDGQSVVGPETTLNVPSSAPPAPPIVHSVIPLLRWDEGTEPEQPVAFRRRRRGGVRIYLERPWYSSGEGELLGVLLAPGGSDIGMGTLASQWGSDPIWVGREVTSRAMFVELDNLLRAAGLDDRPGDALPVTAPVELPLGTSREAPDVLVLGYKPQYNPKRQLWYVDVAIEPGSRMWPFVRLSVARYQPDSIAGCHLSAPVLCDYAQLTPERTASISRTDIRHVRVVVSGPVGVRNPPPSPRIDTGVFPTNVADLADWVAVNRVMIARLQRRDPDIPTDLGWETVDVAELEVKGRGRDTFEAAWVGNLESTTNIPLRRPGSLPNWRVTIEEWERLPGDPADLGVVGIAPPPPVWEQRLVYADHIGL